MLQSDHLYIVELTSEYELDHFLLYNKHKNMKEILFNNRKLFTTKNIFTNISFFADWLRKRERPFLKKKNILYSHENNVTAILCFLILSSTKLDEQHILV
jgi:hypothetical protein